MKFSKYPIPSSQCWKLAHTIPIRRGLRWHVGRQYHSEIGAYNHPFWVHLQRRGILWWYDVGELAEPFYPQEGETLQTFIHRVEKTLVEEYSQNS